MKIFLFFLLFSFSSLAQEVTPTEAFNQSMVFSDDLNFANMSKAIERQLESYKKLGLKGSIKFGKTVYPKIVLKDSLVLLQTIFAEGLECLKSNPEKYCQDQLNLKINANFTLYRPVPGINEAGFGKGKTKFTSYYSPDLKGSRFPTQRFARPIYSLPKLPSDRRSTRVEIDYKGALAGKGYELFWVEESFYDLYLLHVQGGGRINIHSTDGKIESKYLSYVGNNGHSFQMISKYMIEKGYIPHGAIAEQRRFLEENPHKQEEIFSVCPSYVYFKESAEEPYGVNNIPLTEGRSLAIDTRIYKTMGLINFVKTSRAQTTAEGRIKKIPFSRFFISQDTGGAIRGNARCDLYFGYGPEAETTAYNMNELGEQYFLIKK